VRTINYRRQLTDNYIPQENELFRDFIDVEE
jgi:hypothetical protein